MTEQQPEQTDNRPRRGDGPQDEAMLSQPVAVGDADDAYDPDRDGVEEAQNT